MCERAIRGQPEHTDPLSVSDDEPAFASCGGETVIEGGYRAARRIEGGC